MLTYSFLDLGSDSLYEHLYKSIKNDILKGILKPGEKLPSKRSFAKNLGVSTITIENAYGQLIAEGYIYSIPKKGYYVSDFEAGQLSRSIHIGRSPHSHGFYSPEEKSSGKPYFADFISNQTHSDNFPFSIWAKIIRELLSDQQTALMKNSPSCGIFPLQAAIAQHLKDFRGMEIFPEQIIIGAGTEYLYGLLIELLGYDKNYCLEDPSYPKISRIYASHQVKVSHAAMDESGIQVEALERLKAQIVHISPSHHFPTGILMPIGRRYELLGWASRDENRYIIEDDYDSEFRLSGKPVPTLQSIDILEKVIYVNTFTKTLASTIRISYMVLPMHLVRIFYEKLSFYSCTVSTFEQYTLAHFIQEGYFEKHINRMRNYYQKKRNLLLDAIRMSPLADFVTISEEDAGLHFLMEIDTPMDADNFKIRAEEKGVHISSLADYYVLPPVVKRPVFLINYSSIPDEIIPEAVNRIYQCLHD